MSTRCPASVKAAAPAGVSATRCSPVLISRGTATIILRAPSTSRASFGEAAGAAPGPGPEPLERPAIDHLSGLDPGAPRRRHAQPHVAEIVEKMSIRIDGDQHAELGGAPRVDVIEVEPLRGGIDLHRLAV